ncbi:hypothetical protein [Flavobacterium faecale]|uniref:hypothetical protein n=1 Tax=Flavobacterium faecale TaxID=1355330 RepID=UPI003AAF4B63
MTNLLDKSDYKKIQIDLEKQLNNELKRIGDDFKPREFYMKKWNYTLDPSKRAIDYWSWEQGNGKVITPTLKN